MIIYIRIFVYMTEICVFLITLYLIFQLKQQNSESVLCSLICHVNVLLLGVKPSRFKCSVDV